MKLMGDGSASLFTTTTGCRGTDAASLGNSSSVSQLCRKRSVQHPPPALVLGHSQGFTIGKDD